MFLVKVELHSHHHNYHRPTCHNFSGKKSLFLLDNIPEDDGTAAAAAASFDGDTVAVLHVFPETPC